MANRINGFVFDEDEQLTYDWPVRVSKPGGDDTHLIKITFECMDFDEMKELEELAIDDGEATDIVCRVVKDWTVDPKATFRYPSAEEGKLGEIIPCNEENKRKIFNRIYITRQVLKAFFESQGGKKARAKN